MTPNENPEILESLHRTMVQLKTRAEKGQRAFVRMGRQAESLKVSFLMTCLEVRRMALARVRAFSALGQQPGSFEAIASETLFAIFGIIMTVDRPLRGLSGILNTVDRSMRRYGETNWIIGIDTTLTVAPSSDISFGNKWVSWDGFFVALRLLRSRAEGGEMLGDLDQMLKLAEQTGLLQYWIKVRMIKVNPV